MVSNTMEEDTMIPLECLDGSTSMKKSNLQKIPFFDTYFTTKLETSKDELHLDYCIKEIEFILWCIDNIDEDFEITYKWERHQGGSLWIVSSLPNANFHLFDDQLKKCLPHHGASFLRIVQFVSERCDEIILKPLARYFAVLLGFCARTDDEADKCYQQVEEMFTLEQLDEIVIIFKQQHDLWGFDDNDLLIYFIQYLAAKNKLNYITGCEELDIFKFLDNDMILDYVHKYGKINCLLKLPSYNLNEIPIKQFIASRIGTHIAIQFHNQTIEFFDHWSRSFDLTHIVLQSIEPLKYQSFKLLTVIGPESISSLDEIVLDPKLLDRFRIPYRIASRSCWNNGSEREANASLDGFKNSINIILYDDTADTTLFRKIVDKFVRFNGHNVSLQNVSSFDDIAMTKFRLKLDKPLLSANKYYVMERIIV